MKTSLLEDTLDVTTMTVSTATANGNGTTAKRNSNNSNNSSKVSLTAVLTVVLILTTVCGLYLPVFVLNTGPFSSTDSASLSASSTWPATFHQSSLDRNRRTTKNDKLRQLRSQQYALSADSIDGSSGSKQIQQLEDRIRYLETKLNSYLSYTSDPFLRLRNPVVCVQKRKVKEFACPDNEHCAIDNQSVCLDNFPHTATGIFTPGNREKAAATAGVTINTNSKQSSSCVVYDFGIRESPEYGLAFVNQPFNCDVVGFDPSPVSVNWWNKNKEEIESKYNNNKSGGSYTFQTVGAGGIDGKLTLREYDWDQVTILELPQRVVNPNDCNSANQCRFHMHKKQSTFDIPVTTLSTVMSKFGHERITLLKLDVEGSEYMFIERMIDDLSCRYVDQLTLEFHHYDYDTRYGVTSNPQINMLVALLDERCGLQQYWTHESTGWPSNIKLYKDMDMTLYYTLSSFIRTRWVF